MPVSKHAKAQRRIRGTTYKLVRRGYQDRQHTDPTTGNSKVYYGADDAVDDEGVVHHDWVKEEDLHKAYKKSRGGGAGAFDYPMNEEDDGYWDEEDEEDGEGQGEWVDADGEFDEMFGEAGGEVVVGRGEEDLMVKASHHHHQRQEPTSKKVRFDLNSNNTAAPAAAASPTSAMRHSKAHAARGEGEEDEDKLAEAPVRRARGDHGNNRRPRTEDEGEDDEDFEKYLDDEDDEEGDFFDANFEEDDRANKTPKQRRAASHASHRNKSAGAARRAGDADEDDEEKLFDDEMECEVSDEFLRQLVFGTGPAAGVGDDDDDSYDEDGDEAGEGYYNNSNGEKRAALDMSNPPPGMDVEVWNLLTDEERLAVLDGQQAGTQRQRRRRQQQQQTQQTSSSNGNGMRMLDDDDGAEAYPRHQPQDSRALERQFDTMMQEFDSDMKINDFFAQDADGNSTGESYTDPRTMGALGIDKYLSTLEEFVEHRAGVDMETSEPRKNKGLLTQLKILSHNAGVFDYDEQTNGVYMTNNVSDKQRKFVEEFRDETETIRREAKMRVLAKMLEERRRQKEREALAKSGGALQTEEENDDDESGEEVHREKEGIDYEIVEVRNHKKEDRLDCETAVSAYSAYFNQPNVIRAPSRKSSATANRKPQTISAAGKASREGTHSAGTIAVEPAALASSSSSREDDDNHNNGNSDTNKKTAALPPPTFVREKDETKEEKKLRRQAVKQTQRERRQEKSSLKKAYKEMEKEETTRAAVSQGAKRTVKFM